MSKHVEHIQKTLSALSRGDEMMDILLEFERTLDGVELFTYKNWKDGELVQGPNIERYWVTTTWMYPKNNMPDPKGALRLDKIGCKVQFRDDIYKKPVKIMAPSDWANTTTKQAKMSDIPVYLVTIKMPMKYITDRLELSDEFIEREMEDRIHKIAQDYEEEEPMMPEDMEMGGEEEDFGEFDATGPAPADEGGVVV